MSLALLALLSAALLFLTGCRTNREADELKSGPTLVYERARKSLDNDVAAAATVSRSPSRVRLRPTRSLCSFFAMACASAERSLTSSCSCSPRLRLSTSLPELKNSSASGAMALSTSRVWMVGFARKKLGAGGRIGG